MNCTFINNIANSCGGAIYGAASVVNCIFINNSAEMGGAIYDVEIIMNSTFVNNSANDDGGVIYDYKGSVMDCIFINNSAGMCGVILGIDSVVNSTFINNSAKYGGAIYEFSGSVVNSTFINNTSYEHDEVIYGADSVVNSIFINNTGDKKGVNITGNETLNVEIINRTVSGNITVQINNKTYSSELKNNRTAINLDNVVSGKEYDLILTFVSDNKDNFINNTYIIYDKIGIDGSVQPNITQKAIIIIAPDVIKYYNGSEKLKVTLKDKDNKSIANEKINIDINDQTYAKTTDSNGEILMDIDFDAGVYNAIITYMGSSGLTPSKIVKITVKPLASELKLSYVKNSRNRVTLTADVNPSTATGNIVFNVNGREYNAMINNSKASYTLSDMDIGLYNVYSLYGGDVNHENSASKSISFTVDENGIIISAPNVTKYYNGTERFKVQITDEKGIPLNDTVVTMTINGVSYDRTTKFGNASIPLGLPVGVYEVIINCGDYSVRSAVTIKHTIASNDFTKIFKNGTQYLATLTDSQGNLLKEGEATFNINGRFYNRTINDAGVAKLNINLPPGEYTITANNPVTDENRSSIISFNLYR